MQHVSSLSMRNLPSNGAQLMRVLCIMHPESFMAVSAGQCDLCHCILDNLRLDNLSLENKKHRPCFTSRHFQMHMGSLKRK